MDSEFLPIIDHTPFISMISFLQRHWFLIALVTLIVIGATLGAQGQGPRIQPVTDYLNPKLATALILFLMAFSLETGKLWTAVKSPLPVLLGFLMNFGLIPLVAWPLSKLQLLDDFRLGLMIAASVPSTLAAAAVITRKAGGNDAVSLLITMATNLSCFLITPALLRLTTGADVDIKTEQMMVELALTVMLPLALGQLVRQPRPLHDFATRFKTSISTSAQMLIVVVVFSAALRAGIKLHEHSGLLGLGSVLTVWGSCIVSHLAAVLVGLWLAHRCGLPTDISDAVGFAGSQKTLPIGVYIATLPVFQSYPFALLPMLLFHASQLFIDTLLASYLAQQATVRLSGITVVKPTAVAP